MKRFVRRELLFLLIPCVALFAYAYYLSVQPKEPRFVFDRIEVEPSIQPGYYTDVVMHLYARGPWPRALVYPFYAAPKPGGIVGEFGFAPRGELFYEKEGKLHRFQWSKGQKSILHGVQHRGGSRRFVVRCALNLAAVPPELKPLKCRMRLAFYDYQKPNRNIPVATAEGSVELRSTP